MVKFGVGIFFPKSTRIGRFSIFMKTSSFGGLGALFEYKNDNFSRFFFLNEGLAAGGHQAPNPRASTESTCLFRSSLTTSYATGCKKKKWVCEWVITFWVLYFFETFTCLRGVLHLNCYMGEKLQTKSYGFINLEKLRVVILFFFKILYHRTIFNFSCKTSVFAKLGALFE